MKGHSEPTISVLAPHLSLTVTIESGRDDHPDEVHIHPGGQGFWVARMLRHLGERPLLCGPVGGESGRVITGLFAQWGLDPSPTKIEFDSPVTVQDRRSGDRRTVAETDIPRLKRHEIDDLYGTFLDRSMSSSVCVITGQPHDLLPPDFYRRLGNDLATDEVTVVADIHGEDLKSLLKGGPVDILKVSHDDLRADGILDGGGDSECLAAIDKLSRRGASAVVLSRDKQPALARFGESTFSASVPELEPADFRGTGDSMTAGLAAAARRGLTPGDTLRLACAAGAANVTRHGLGSAKEELITRLVERIDIDVLSPV